MGKNVGTFDRILRIIAGAILIAYVVYAGPDSPLNWAGIVAGVVLIGTALVGWCPAYRLIGLRT